jgi:hypothetical protein
MTLAVPTAASQKGWQRLQSLAEVFTGILVGATFRHFGSFWSERRVYAVPG